ncbi:hypothetical protein GCM10010517_16760 [Streptosporangium fragile]|uniref:Uncharacterized protein n=1 Tax=Streptosporangium fragile TaxID=46186 RepID=A0ABN3VTK2_9ACTN
MACSECQAIPIRDDPPAMAHIMSVMRVDLREKAVKEPTQQKIRPGSA